MSEYSMSLEITAQELFEANIARWQFKAPPRWEDQNAGIQRDYEYWASEASATGRTVAEALERIVDPMTRRAWGEHEFPPLKDKTP